MTYHFNRYRPLQDISFHYILDVSCHNFQLWCNDLKRSEMVCYDLSWLVMIPKNDHYKKVEKIIMTVNMDSCLYSNPLISPLALPATRSIIAYILMKQTTSTYSLNFTNFAVRLLLVKLGAGYVLDVGDRVAWISPCSFLVHYTGKIPANNNLILLGSSSKAQVFF